MGVIKDFYSELELG